MKNIDDIMEMKNKPCSPFENMYVFFFMNLKNNLLSKRDGIERNNQILSEYDKEAQTYILEKLSLMMDHG